MQDFNAATGNLTLTLSVIAWAAAQTLKGVIHLVRFRKFDWRIAMGSGGMPSSHSAFVCAAAASVGRLCGWRSVSFSIIVILAFIVMYDASHVRRAAGEQAQLLNDILEHWNEMPPHLRARELKELLGHTNLQVMFGALLGVIIGLLGTFVAMQYYG